MRPVLSIVLAFLASAAFAQAPARVASLEWMAGSWVRDDGRERVAETWLGPGNGLLVAANLTTLPGGRSTFEFLRIAETSAGFSYFASPGGRVPVEFPLKELADRKVVFENPTHDFPRRIAYWRDGEALVARIEGTLRGEARHEEWRFHRQR